MGLESKSHQVLLLLEAPGENPFLASSKSRGHWYSLALGYFLLFSLHVSNTFLSFSAYKLLTFPQT